jgi:hypothetical protein
MSGKPRKRREKADIQDCYRRLLHRPDLSEREIQEMREHLGRLARAICEHVWGKKFY